MQKTAMQKQWVQMLAGGRAVACLLLATATVAGPAACEAGRPPAPQPAPGSASPPGYGCAVPAPGPVDAASVLVPGPTNNLPPSKVSGERLVIAGVVLDAACRPATAMDLYLWHTDAHGDYGPRGTQQCCYYAGTVRTDRNGRFRLETIRPAQYPQPDAPPAHIHVEIRQAPTPLTTEIIFTAAAATAPTVAVRTGERVYVALRRGGSGDTNAWYGEVTFVLER
ncbi:MAG TPA: hypothetical protein VFM54_19840 [Micromonosporaceae bacterium]|nr:hypothetical protein [Micromonosporaceae bacterium]